MATRKRFLDISKMMAHNLASYKSNGFAKGQIHTKVRIEPHSLLSKIIVYATIASGFVAAYLMYKRGESLVAIARNTVTNPIGSLVYEVQNVV
jgi:hypothetical protein